MSLSTGYGITMRWHRDKATELVPSNRKESAKKWYSQGYGEGYAQALKDLGHYAASKQEKEGK